MIGMLDARWAAQLIALVGLVLLAVRFVRWSLFSLNALPKGELLESYPSPEGRYRIDVYLVDNDTATEWAVRAAVVHMRTRRARSIYWQYGQSEAKVRWIDEENVVISGAVFGKERYVELNVKRDQYDYRKAR